MPGNIVNLTPETIASWPTPNYVDPVTRDWMPIYAGVWYGVSTLLIAVRLWLRILKQAGGLGLDDYLLVFAWFGSSMFTTCLIISTTAYDADRHAWDIPLQNFEKIALMAWLAQFSWLVTGAATKISVLCFYRRLVAGTYSRRWKWAVIGAIIFTAGWTLAFLLMLIFNCNPTEAYWKAFDLTWEREYTCIDTDVINLLAGVFAVISDLYAVALPCLMTRHFELPGRQKIALNLIFCLGLLVVASSGVRTYFLYQVGFRSDVTWTIFDTHIAAQLELQLSIICASLPALRVFLRRYLTEPFSRTGRSGGNRPGTALSYQTYQTGQTNPKSPRFAQSVRDSKQTVTPHTYAVEDGQARATFAGDQKERYNTIVTEEEGQSSSEYDDPRSRSRSPSAPSEAPLWRGAKSSESYDMSVLPRTSDLTALPASPTTQEFQRAKSSRSRGNFSQPFGQTTFFDEG